VAQAVPPASCSCESAGPSAKSSAPAQSVIANVAAEVVDRFLARRGASGSKGGFG
jgi:hypothetical protein